MKNNKTLYNSGKVIMLSPPKMQGKVLLSMSSIARSL